MSTYVAPASEVEDEWYEVESFKYSHSPSPDKHFRPGWWYVRDCGEESESIIAGPFQTEANADRWIEANIEGAMTEAEWEARHGGES